MGQIASTKAIVGLEEHRRLASALEAPERYAWSVEEVRRIETHISTVLLAGDYALKLKKPLDLGFLDFTSLERRRHFCEEEIRLNSRLAPEIYLRRVPISGTIESPRIDGQGPVVEHAVLMRRFPEKELMNRLLMQGRLPCEAVQLLADTVADFHERLPAVDPESDYGRPHAVAEPLRENFQQLFRLEEAATVREELVELWQWSESQLKHLAQLMHERRIAGAVRECHGDLHLGNVAWHEGKVIVFDGIEFDPALRWIDTANEIAFTVMDLDFLGAARLRNCFLDRYLERTGDYRALYLLPFYAVYRALVRAKINGREAAQGQDPQAGEELREHVSLATAYTQEQTPVLAITYGLSGSGKSTLAGKLVEQGYIRLRSDVERKRLFGLNPGESSHSGLYTGIYTPEATQGTYDRLLSLAEEALKAGFCAVVDASFLRASHRRPFRELALRLGCGFRILHLWAEEETLRARLRRRRAEGRDPSEAGEAVLEEQLRWGEPPAGVEEPFVRVIEANG